MQRRSVLFLSPTPPVWGSLPSRLPHTAAILAQAALGGYSSTVVCAIARTPRSSDGQVKAAMSVERSPEDDAGGTPGALHAWQHIQERRWRRRIRGQDGELLRRSGSSQAESGQDLFVLRGEVPCKEGLPEEGRVVQEVQQAGSFGQCLPQQGSSTSQSEFDNPVAGTSTSNSSTSSSSSILAAMSMTTCTVLLLSMLPYGTAARPPAR